MALVKVKPTSAGRRSLVKVVNPNLHKGPPVASLVESQKRGSGRNNNGHITMRHQGGGHKHHYRIVDFKRNKDGIPAKVERLEYDPNRSAHLALLLYADGERRYVIAPRGVAVGQQLTSGAEAAIKPGNTLPLRNIPVGTTIHCIELKPGAGAQMARSAGAAVQLLAREGAYAQLRMRSGEIRKVHVDCRATIGEVGNEEHSLRSIGKAGANRWRGIRPTVRGIAMNPVDHPHGDVPTAAGIRCRRGARRPRATRRARTSART
jgi:large subunit ribosomal protein L2